MGQQQQTVLKVYYNNSSTSTILDTYSSIPLTVTRSYAELQDIAVRNSDLSINLLLPGSKKNNRFFENFFDVDVDTLFFNATLKAIVEVSINDEIYFGGYLKLNKVSVLDSKVEYDVSLYSSIGNLFGDIGNHLLNELNFDDPEYTFNHMFSATTVQSTWSYSNFSLNQEKPPTFFYPVVHNGYLYSGDTVNFTGGTLLEQTRLYTSTTPIGSYQYFSGFTGAGGLQYRINSPKQGLFDNQLKPALSVWNILKLMFKTHGYSIKSDFFNTPWMKSLYMYGYFSSAATKFSFNTTNPNSYPLSGVQIIFDCPISGATFGQFKAIITTPSGIPCFANNDVSFHAEFYDTNFPYYPYNYIIDGVITAGTTGYSENVGLTFLPNLSYSNDVPTGHNLKYFPQPVNTVVPFVDGVYVNFSQVIDIQYKQIDILSSIAKKFNLVMIPNPLNPKEILIEPFEYYIGTGNIYDWTDKLSFDKGFTVEPALNYIESSLNLSDLEDGDYGNKQFKDQNNRLYGQLFLNNPSDFKSQEKVIETTFSSQVVRQWDLKNQTIPNGGIKLPLGINYAGSSSSNTSTSQSESTSWNYAGVKTKIKLLFNLGSANLFADQPGEVYNAQYDYKSYQAWICNSNNTIQYGNENLPIVCHTMPIGVKDQFKTSQGFDVDTCSLLYRSEESVYIDGNTNTYDCYTNNSAYSLFYSNRVNNLYNKDTRFLTGNFYIKLNEYKNLKANDLIKIKDKYFLWNKIDNYNLTNTELTKVELVQINNVTSTYPTRYFKYQYCDNTGYTFSIKTDFTNPNLLYTLFGWSIFYDYNCGLIYGPNQQPSGFTSTLLDIRGGLSYYVGYTIKEINESEYNSSGYYDWTRDTMMTYIFSIPKGPFGTRMPTFWINSSGTTEGFNIFTGCTSFNTTVSTYGIRTESSTYYGSPIPATPTPTPTSTLMITPTPSVTRTPIICPTHTPTPTPSETPGITPSQTHTPTPTHTPTHSPTPTHTSTPTVTPTHTVTPTITPTITPTNTVTPTPSAVPTGPATKIYVNGTSASYPRTGTTWYSLSTGTTYNADLINSPTFSTSNGGYFDFNGTNQYADFGVASAGDNLSSRSFGGWFKMDSPNPGSDMVFLYRGIDVGGGGADGWSLVLYKAGSGEKISLYAIAGGGISSSVSLTASQWYYIIGVWTTTGMKLYVNGNLEATNSYGSTGLRNSTSFGWIIGRGNSGQYWPVQSGAFELYETVLTDAEVLANFNLNKTQYGY
jgi:hypothetical protein